MIREKNMLSLFSTLKDAVSGVCGIAQAFNSSASPMAEGFEAVSARTYNAARVPGAEKAPFMKESIVIGKGAGVFWHTGVLSCFSKKKGVMW